MLVPEELGGIGADIGDAVAILRSLGEAAAPGPIVETMLANALLARSGHDAVKGVISLSFAQDADRRFHNVPWGGVSDHLLVVTPQRVGLFTGGISVDDQGLDAAGEPRDTISITADGIWRDCDTSCALETAAVMRAGQILGAIEWTLARTVEYAGERKQFGREIAKFQVVQQMLAELAGHVLASSGVTEAAAEMPTAQLVAAARSRLGDAADAAIGVGHQVHGALGFSKEYALNHRTRHLMAWRDDFGSVPFWRRRLASSLTGCGRDGLWPQLITLSAAAG
jgi:acyl-CoA dehydrogenase